MKITPELIEEYESLFASCEIDEKQKDSVQWALGKIERRKEKYLPVAAKTGVPWEVIGVIHGLEASFDLNSHLHNGDPLEFRTVQVPSGRPFIGKPPFTWEESALDALEYDGAARNNDWSIAGTLFFLEKYNGWGYRNKAGHRSPYLWSMTNHNTPGKYVADGVFDPTAISAQVGACAMLKALNYGGALGVSKFVMEVGEEGGIIVSYFGQKQADSIKTNSVAEMKGFFEKHPDAKTIELKLVKPKKEEPKPKQAEALLTATGRQYEEGRWAGLLELELRIEDELFHVSSGAVDAQNLRLPSDKNSYPGNFEPIPQGKYSIGTIDFAGGKDTYDEYHSNGLGPVWIPLPAQFKDDRSAFGIHLDGNIERAPGSAGCVVLKTLEELKRLIEVLRKYDPQTLVVDWNL